MHRIRLHAAWRCGAADADRPGRGATSSIRLPIAVGELAATGTGPLELTRTFHAPTGIDVGQALRLWFAELPVDVEAWLNETLLMLAVDRPAPSLAADVTSLLRPHNRLVLRLANTPPPALIGAIELRIEPPR